MCRRRARSPIVAALLAATIGQAGAQTTFPDQPIKIIVPNAPGGFIDSLARGYASQMAVDLGHALVADGMDVL